MNREHIDAAKSVPIESVIDQRGIKLRGKIERVGSCPQCGGEDRFAVNTAKQVFNCRGCGAKGSVIDLVMFLDGVDFAAAVNTLAPSKANGRDGEASKAAKESQRATLLKKIRIASFEYHDAGGALVFVADRYQFKRRDGGFEDKDGKPKKTFGQRRPDPDRLGEWIHNVEGIASLIYRLPEVIEAVASDHPIVVVEGEAKANLLASWNIAATCNSGGAGKWRTEHSEYLRGADVVLCPDNDDAGWHHIHQVGASLVGIAKSVRVLTLPDARVKDDIINWRERGGTREALDALIASAPAWHEPTAAEIDSRKDDQKAEAKRKEDELLDALVKLQGLDYARALKDAAGELDLSQKAVDQEVKERREDAVAAPLYGHWDIEPWPEPVEGDSLLRDIIRRFKRQVVIADEYALTIALFLMMSAVHDDVATHSPILNINSAEPESGKSTTLGLISFLMPKCISSVEATEAAIYRAIKRWQPSFCFDEFDSILADDDKAALRSVINSGHTRGQGVLRCIGDDKVPELFSTFAPKVIGMVGRKLPPATLSRCIFIELRRRMKGEQFEKFHHEDDAELAGLRRRIKRWAFDNIEALRHIEPTMPEQLQNRRADNWCLLIAISDLCTGPESWGDKARAAAVKIETGSDSRTANARALAATRTVFDSIESDAISSEDLIQKMTANPDSEWREWKGGKPITQAQMARLLKSYGIAPEPVRIDGRQIRGYLRSCFVDAWERYL